MADRSYYGDGMFSIGALEMFEDFVNVFVEIGEGKFTLNRVMKDVGKVLAPFGIPYRNAWNLIKAFLEWIGVEIE